MSVTRVTITAEDYSIAEGVHTGSRTYQVDVTSETADDAQTVLTATDGTTSIPAILDLFKAASTAKARSKKAERLNGDPYTYTVTVDYSSKGEDEDSLENPLAKPTQYAYSDESFQEPYFRDVDGVAIVNSAGEPFANLPQRDRSNGIITITRNVTSFDDGAAEAKRNTINSAAETINGVQYAARTLRIKSINGSGPREENGISHWTETTTIAKKLDTWDHFLEDRGLNELDAGELVSVKDKEGEPVVLPWPLDGTGAAKAASTDTPAQGTAKPYLAGAFPSFS